MDHGLIMMTEDAFTVNADTDEIELGLLNLYSDDGKYSNWSRAEVKYGFADSFEGKFGVGVAYFTRNKFTRVTAAPIEGTLKYNFLDETYIRPAMSLLAGVNYIAQSQAELRDGTVILKYLATKTFDKMRMNLNINYVTTLDKFYFARRNFQFGYSIDYLFEKPSIMLMGEIFNPRENQYRITLGLRKRFLNNFVISGGLGKDVGRVSGADFQAFFSLAWLNGL
jgi:hypothetical protein